MYEYIYDLLFRMADTMVSQSIDVSSLETLYAHVLI
jgi:hypothetical protein